MHIAAKNMNLIKNEYLQVGVKSTGAELCSIKSPKTGLEYLWQADPKVWGNHAPVLFPIVGGLKNGKYLHQGQSYAMPKHGIVRYNEQVQLREQSPDSLLFSLQSNEQSRIQYPFEFAFWIEFRLWENQLTISHRVQNEGSETMYFSLGAHPAFACPRREGEVYEDYYLEFSQEEQLRTWMLDDEGLIAEEGALMLDHARTLPLHQHLFDHDALIFKNQRSDSVSLKSNKSSEVLTVHFVGWPYLGIWAKPAAPFVCIEPWYGIADGAGTDQQLANKEGIMLLPSGEAFEASYRIEVEE
jgi:galactose mutarotase-like enzyme